MINEELHSLSRPQDPTEQLNQATRIMVSSQSLRGVQRSSEGTNRQVAAELLARIGKSGFIYYAGDGNISSERGKDAPSEAELEARPLPVRGRREWVAARAMRRVLARLGF